MLSTGNYRQSMFSLFSTVLSLKCTFISFEGDAMNWWAANRRCKSKGGKLVEIDSEKENTALVEEINKRGYTGKNFWIGLTNWGSWGVWWLAASGLKPSYLKWHDDQPDGGAYHCARVRIGPYSNWKDTWSDINCQWTHVTIDYNTYDWNGKAIPHTHTNSMHALCEFSQTTVSSAEDPSTDGWYIYAKATFLKIATNSPASNSGTRCSTNIACVKDCEEGWEQNGNHYYLWSTAKLSWTEAEHFCRNKSGHLTSVTSNTTNDYIEKGNNQRGLNSLWIGGLDLGAEGSWRWADCSVWEFTLWASREPNNRWEAQNCLNYHPAKDHLWGDQIYVLYQLVFSAAKQFV